ncbi:hypothetical protein K488DRAFT_85103 [Vararia minispora EC-137]|uniref:Uncharacterized protein n=1 Tax=Vararia minispora EC-137 TaxID=1314806 RepID=A0ACB8QNL1_9AGAM|nr:hypothetical protein K488DRAFT_85103 [Vararia minispora EC-137]
MAGGSIRVPDPAISRWTYARENVYRHFRWTRHTASIAFWLVGVVPAGLFWLAVNTDNKYKVIGTRKDQSLLRGAPVQSAAEITDE